MLAQFELHIESSVPKQAFLSLSLSILGKYTYTHLLDVCPPSNTHSGAGVRWIFGIRRSSTNSLPLGPSSYLTISASADLGTERYQCS